MITYALPRFTRGHGFGNRLFPWARARVFAMQHGARFVDPVWARWAVGPVLRGGIALRHYRTQILLVGLFHRRAGDAPTLRGRWAARRAVRVPEPADPRAAWAPPEGARGDVRIDFVGYREFFGPILGWGQRLLPELREITRPRYLSLADRREAVPIALNVRCGRDFPRAAAGARRLGFGEATPISWFVRTLRAVRQTAGRPVAAYVVSDGTPGQLVELLEEPQVELVRPGCAISDLLTIARARVLLASGSSSFSAWGAYLGEMPCASHPGQPLTAWRLPEHDGSALRAEFDPAAPNPEFLAAAAQALRS